MLDYHEMRCDLGCDPGCALGCAPGVLGDESLTCSQSWESATRRAHVRMHDSVHARPQSRAPTTAAEGVHLGTALRPILLERIKSQRTLGDDGVPREAHIGQY